MTEIAPVEFVIVVPSGFTPPNVDDVAAGMLAAGIVPVNVDEPNATVKPAPVAPPVNVPTDVRLEAVTPAASVAPVSVPAGAAFSVAKVPKDDPLVFVQVMFGSLSVQSPPIVKPPNALELLY